MCVAPLKICSRIGPKDETTGYTALHIAVEMGNLEVLKAPRRKREREKEEREEEKKEEERERRRETVLSDFLSSA